jgi:hypothetical protein
MPFKGWRRDSSVFMSSMRSISKLPGRNPEAFSEESFDFIPLEAMSFATNEAPFPPETLARTLAAEYERQCRQLCLGPHPPWADVRQRFEQMRALLGVCRESRWPNEPRPAQNARSPLGRSRL